MPLPWAAVNQHPPARVGDLLELPRSRHGGRKRACPFCGGSSFAPITHVFFCYSGCGGTAYSNVDVAARVWDVEPAAACRRLAELLGVPFEDSTAAWAEVASYSTQAVGTVLGLTPASGPWKWDCPVCGEAAMLRSYRRVWRCGSTRCSGNRNGWHGHVALAAAVWRTSPADACARLAASLSGKPLTPPVLQPPVTRVTAPSPRDQALAAIRARPGGRVPEDVYRLLLEHLRLGRLGRAELARRGIDGVSAYAYGFRSTEPDEWRARVLPLMGAFSDDELVAAGFPRQDSSRVRPALRLPWWPGRGRAPLLVIPIRDGTRIAGVRFRNLADPAETRCPRYVSPKDVAPELPFHVEAMAAGAPTLHLVEGELNAWVLSNAPYAAAAVGLPGAGTWRDEWTARIPDRVRHVVGWFDADAAGLRGAMRVRESLARVRGPEWARDCWRVLHLATDVCDLHAEGRLASLLGRAPWAGQDPASLWPDTDPDADHQDRA